MPDRDNIHRAPVDPNTFLVLYLMELDGKRLHAHLLSAAGSTHCIDAHFSRTLPVGEDIDNWRTTFDGATVRTSSNARPVNAPDALQRVFATRGSPDLTASLNGVHEPDLHRRQVLALARRLLARALQERLLPDQWFHFSPDTLLYCLPKSTVDRADLANDWSAIDTKLINELTYGCVRDTLRSGARVVFDCVVMTERRAEAASRCVRRK